MTATLSLAATPLVEHRVSPELLAYTSMLALPMVDFESAVDREVERNPALERIDTQCCVTCGESYPCACRAAPRCSASKEGAPLDAFIAAELSPAEALVAELRPLCAASEHRILSYLVDCLDHRGRLEVTADEIAAALDVSVPRVEAALALVRRHGPPGIAAADLRECLLLQLERLRSEGCGDELAQRIVEECLEPLGAGRVGATAAALGVSREEVARAVEFMRSSLRPHVSLGETRSVTPLALPDLRIVAVPGSCGAFTIELLEQQHLKLIVSPGYERLLLAGDDLGTDRDHVRSQVAQARSFIDRVERRWQTMRAVTEVVVEYQRDYLARGARYIAPLTRAEVAASVGVHESTVSRATCGRYALLPSRRIVPLARFFDRSQGPCAALAQLIADESAARSDASLARQLAREGFKVSRRTVAKYREKLGIPAHGDR